MKNRGFTLIELLVVIAIIGILASVVLASLNSARDKGADAAIKSNLANLRAQAEIVYDSEPGCYGDGDGSGCLAAGQSDSCAATGDTIFGNSNVVDAISAVTNGSGKLVTCDSTANQQGWAIMAQLKSADTEVWCVDSTGSSKQSTVAAPANQAAMDALLPATAICP